MSNTNDITSSESNHNTGSRGNYVIPTCVLSVESEEGINLCVDLNSNLLEWITEYTQTNAPREDEFEAPTEIDHGQGMALEDDIGRDDMLPVTTEAQPISPGETEEVEEVAMEEETGRDDDLIVTEGAQLTLISSDNHESPVENDLVAQEVVMEEDISHDDELPDSNQVPITHANQDDGLTNHSLGEDLNHTSSTLPPIASAQSVDAVTHDAALQPQIMGAPNMPGDVTENNNDQMNDLLQPLLKIRDNILHMEHTLQGQSAECDMDIQKILTEGKMTPKVLEIRDKYKEIGSSMTEVTNPSCCGDGVKSRGNKRMRLKEALLQHNKRQLQELDKICCDIKCIPPRYTILPSLEYGMFHSSIQFTCPGYDMSTTGGPHQTPDGARCSAAASLIMELHKKAMEEEEQERDANIPS